MSASFLRSISRKIAAEPSFLRRISPNCFSTVAADRQILSLPSTSPPWLIKPPPLQGEIGEKYCYPFFSHPLSGVNLPLFPGGIMDGEEELDAMSIYDPSLVEETETEYCSSAISNWDLAASAFPKTFKGRMNGVCHRGHTISFGKYALKAVESGWVTARQIEAGRRAMARNARGAKIWVRVIADKPVTEKPAEVRMGRGKGSPAYRVAVVQPGRILYELDGVPENVAKVAVTIAASKLSVATTFVHSGYTL